MKKLIETIIAAVICLFVIIGGINLFTDVSGSFGEDVEISIPEGASGGDIAQRLKDSGIIEHPVLFKIYASLTGKDTEYKSGDFTVGSGFSYGKILKTLTSAPNSVANKVKITIPEGFEAEKIAKAMETAGITSAEEFLAAASSSDYDFDFIKNIKNRENRKYLLEGYLFPDTYTFSKNTPAKTVVNTMLATFEQVSKKYNIENIDDTIILASIIEREALGDIDRRKVSSVFHNRLKRTDYLSKLQSCATVQYILGERKAVLSEADTKIDSPYNTYLYSGLPAGPISNPGEESIKAAITPENTDYLYFGLGKDGEHIFSKTFEEHLRATQ